MEVKRMCCVCRERKPVAELVRIVREKSGGERPTYKYFIDPRGNANGRGCYICKSSACTEKAIKTRALNRSFKQNVGEEIYRELAKQGEVK